jgi:hypothetical protein
MSASAEKAITMTNARDKWWLMKVPDFVMSQLTSINDEGAPIGELVPDEESSGVGAGSSSSSGGVGGRSRSFSLKLAPALAGSIPQELQELTVTLNAPPHSMHILSEPKDPSNGGWRMEGCVEYKGEMKAKKLTEDYKDIIKARVEAAAQKREIQTWDEDGGAQWQGQIKQSQVSCDLSPTSIRICISCPDPHRVA